jgi:hypothetical protein
MAIWYIFHRFGILCQEKSGNPAEALRDRPDDLTQVNIANVFF